MNILNQIKSRMAHRHMAGTNAYALSQMPMFENMLMDVYGDAYDIVKVGDVYLRADTQLLFNGWLLAKGAIQ